MAHEYANGRYQYQMSSAVRVIYGTAKWPFRIFLFALMNTGHRWRPMDRHIYLTHEGHHQIDFSFFVKYFLFVSVWSMQKILMKNLMQNMVCANLEGTVRDWNV